MTTIDRIAHCKKEVSANKEAMRKLLAVTNPTKAQVTQGKALLQYNDACKKRLYNLLDDLQKEAELERTEESLRG